MLAVLILGIGYKYLIPGCVSLIPKDYQLQLKSHSIDATPLFYTESEEAQEAGYFMLLRRGDQ